MEFGVAEGIAAAERDPHVVRPRVQVHGRCREGVDVDGLDGRRAEPRRDDGA